MAKVGRKKKSTLREAEKAVGIQAPAGVWTPGMLMKALQDATADKSKAAALARLQNAGIVDANGKLTGIYKKNGWPASKVTRTPAKAVGRRTARTRA